jgi:hypothetical protein
MSTLVPGEATVQKFEDGTRRVVRADPLVRISVALLESMLREDGSLEQDGTLVLDSAGEYRYRFLCAESATVHIYERVSAPPQFTVGVSAIVTGHAVHPPGTVLPAPQEVGA